MVVGDIASGYNPFRSTPTRPVPKMKSEWGNERAGMRSFVDNVISPFVRCVAPSVDGGCAPVCTSSVPVPRHFRRRNPAVVSPLGDRRYPTQQQQHQQHQHQQHPTSPINTDTAYPAEPKSQFARTPMSPAESVETKDDVEVDRCKDIAKPHSNDVLCGRGGSSNRHTGNINFRELVAANKQTYINLTKKQKMLIARKIVDTVRGTSPQGRFLARDTDTSLWYDIGIPRSLEKTSQALREKNSNDAIHLDQEGFEVCHQPEPSQASPMEATDDSTAEDAPTSKSKNKKQVEAPPLAIPPHLVGVYRPSQQHFEESRRDGWRYDGQQADHAEHAYSDPYARHPPSPSPSHERYGPPTHVPYMPSSRALPYYKHEHPAYRHSHHQNQTPPARPAPYDHEEYGREQFPRYEERTEHYTNPHVPGTSSSYRPSPHFSTSPSRHHIAGHPHPHPPVPTSHHPHPYQHPPHHHTSQHRHVHAHPHAHASRPPPHYRPQRHPHSPSNAPPPGWHPLPPPTPSSRRTMYPPSPIRPPASRQYEYGRYPEQYIPHPDAMKSMHHSEISTGERIHRQSPSSGYIRSKGDVSPDRRQEWKRRRDEGMVRKLSDASLSRAVEHQLSLHDRGTVQERETPQEPPTCPDLKSPSSVLQSRSRRQLPSREIAAAETLSGLAALSTAAFLKLDGPS